MEPILPTNEFTEVEGRYYANPQASLDRSNTFIDNLRATQGQQNQQIAQQTQNLGTNVPTNLGGLTGANSYFTSRYQVPQTNAAVSNLRAAAQATALNQALQNEQEIWKKRYQDAYRKYQKSAYDKANTPAVTEDPTTGGIEKEDNTDSFYVEGTVPGVAGGYTVGTFIPDWDNMTGEQTGIVGVPYGEEYETNYYYDMSGKQVNANTSADPFPVGIIKNGIGGVSGAGLNGILSGGF